MEQQPFARKKHVYHNEAFVELVKDAVRFFNGTPVHSLPPPVSFKGSGVYAIYYIDTNPLYAPYASQNRLAYVAPIYVGKAVPRGWRQARMADSEPAQATELFNRLKEHNRSLSATADLRPADFMCRFVIFEGPGSDMIGTIEAALIKIHRPLWNSCLDGFGNHDPGSGRYQQAKPDWDVVHPGRLWAEKLTGKANIRATLIANIQSYLHGGEETS